MRSNRLALRLSTILVLTLCATTPASAAILLEDGLDYPDGPLLGQGAWAAHSAAGSKPIQIAGGSAVLQLGPGSGEDLNLKLAVPRPYHASTFYSAMVMVPTTGTLGAADYFMHLRPAPPDTLGFRARLLLSAAADAGHFTAGIRVLSAGSSDAIWPEPLERGRNYLWVVGYDARAGSARLWINPATPDAPSIVSAILGDSATVGLIALRQGSPTGANYTVRVDHLAVAETFEDLMGFTTEVRRTTWGRIKALYR